MLFVYADYYPQGGMNDFINSFDDLGKAVFEGKKELESYTRSCASADIYDLTECKNVKSMTSSDGVIKVFSNELPQRPPEPPSTLIRKS